MKDKELEKKLIKETEESLKTMLNDGITDSNLDYIYKLVDIHKDLKEEESMNYRGYGNYGYGNMGGYGEYGRGGYGEGSYGEGNYGRRGVPGSGRRRYRGDDMLNEMHEEYGAYMEGGSYGGEDTMKALKYMLKSAEDFFKHIQEEAKSPEEIEMVKETARKISMM